MLLAICLLICKKVKFQQRVIEAILYSGLNKKKLLECFWKLIQSGSFRLKKNQAVQIN